MTTENQRQRHLGTLARRHSWLAKRVVEGVQAGRSMDYDRAECTALEWALAQLTEEHACPA